jgi:hypothetical protein
MFEDSLKDVVVQWTEKSAVHVIHDIQDSVHLTHKIIILQNGKR